MFLINLNAEIVACILSFRKSRHKPNLENTSKYGFSPNLGEKNGGVLSMRMQVILDISWTHSRPQRPRSFWSALRIATSGLAQRHPVFEWLCKYNRLRPEPIRFIKLDSEHAQSDGKSVNRGLPVLGLGQRSRFLVLTKRSAAWDYQSDSSFARPGSAPLWDMGREERRVQGLDYIGCYNILCFKVRYAENSNTKWYRSVKELRTLKMVALRLMLPYFCR